MTDIDLISEERPPEPTPETRGYLDRSRALVNSLVLVAPLFVVYQIGILFTDGWKNAVDFVTSRLYDLVGDSTPIYLVVNLGVLAAILLAARLIDEEYRLTKGTWGIVFLESAIYAFLLGGVVTRILRLVGIRPMGLSLSTADNLVLSFGAGAYEELVFRLLLISALLWIGKKLDLGRLWLVVGVLVISSVLFSLAHYPPFGSDTWQFYSFAYRVIAGLIFAGIFLLRGFAIAAYTHAFYDVGVLVL